MNEQISATMKKLLEAAITKKASDLHLTVGVSPLLRVDSRLIPLSDYSALKPETIRDLIKNIMSKEQIDRLFADKEIDFSFSFEETRFRTNVFFQKGVMAASLRLIHKEIRSIKELGLPPIVERFTSLSQGFVIVTGPTGHGKSTTLAAMIEEINKNRSEHIITLEDPIEYIFEHKKSIISQREVGSDTNSFDRALRATLREDPNVVLVGEMRDLETIEAALTVAETGHLVFTTLHTNSAAQTADRIIDVFPSHQQQQVRSQLANVLAGIVSQRLIPRVSGGRIAAFEVMIINAAARNLIREGKTHQLDNLIQTSATEGMISIDKVLAELISKGEITIDDGLTWSLNPKELKTMIY